MDRGNTTERKRTGFSYKVRRKLFFKLYNNSYFFKKLVDTNRKKAIGLMWEMTFGISFPWNNPTTLNEKISWLAAMTDLTEWTRCSDKYEVRKFVERLGMGHLLTKCYGVWNSFDEIDFNTLPDSFVLKCTHDCGSTVVVKDKAKMDYKKIKKFINSHLKKKMGYKTCEPHYTKIRPRIMAEELLIEDPTIGSCSPIDYKFWCFGEVAEYVFLAYDRQLGAEGGHRASFDIYETKTWTPARQYLSEEYRIDNYKNIPKPKNLEEMVAVAKRLSTGFPQVRIDMYNINGRILFGEMTFTSNGGRMRYFTDEFQKTLGDKIDLKKYGVNTDEQ